MKPPPFPRATRRHRGLCSRCAPTSLPLPFPALLLLLLLVLQVLGASAATVRVYAAASLTEALREIAAAYQKETGDTVRFNLGASSFLARQIEEGAPADIFFSADEARMDALEKKGRIAKDTRRSRLSNVLVVVVPTHQPVALRSPKDLAGPSVRRLALADPRTVPAGLYAREYLEKAGLWNAVERKVVPTDNVRAALAAVESGNVEAGIVYKTDAAISRQVRIACEVPVAEGPAISYPVALVRESKEPEAARRFLRYLDSENATRVFRQHGFLVRP